MPGEHSGGQIGQIGSAPSRPSKPRNNPGGKTRRAPKHGQTTAPKRKPSRGTVAGGQNGQRAGNSKPKAQPRSGGGGGGGAGFGGGLTSTGSGGLGMAAPAPAAPNINDFLSGDDTYQSQVAALTKALANYKSQMGERQDEYGQDFSRRLTDLNLNETRNTTDQADDYAGRGIYLSGLYGKARGDLEQDYDSREGDMNLAKTQFLTGLTRDYTNFGEENNLSKERAKQDAINRRALQYGVG